MSEPFHVLIIGGGIGGLTLAQGLKRAGISAAVYERDRTLTDRLQGYRVHISPTGGLALHECLPPHLFEVFDRTCGAPTTAVRFFTEQMRLLLAFDGNLIASADPVARHRSASRITLRQLLLAELANVHFGKTFERYEGAAELSAAATRAMAGWSRAFFDLVGLTDPTTISCLPIRTSVPIPPWRTGHITLLGDAIHSMTPYRGIGANVAIKDAARLKHALVAAHRGDCDLVEAIHDYEAGMLDYGFRAVRNSLKAMHQTVTDSLSKLVLSRLTLRAINVLPLVKRIVAKRMGEE